VDRVNGLYIYVVGMNLSNQLEAADREWSSSSGGGKAVNNSLM
jgi:hypothetical protein